MAGHIGVFGAKRQLILQRDNPNKALRIGQNGSRVISAHLLRCCGRYVHKYSPRPQRPRETRGMLASLSRAWRDGPIACLSVGQGLAQPLQLNNFSGVFYRLNQIPTHPTLRPAVCAALNCGASLFPSKEGMFSARSRSTSAEAGLIREHSMVPLHRRGDRRSGWVRNSACV